MSDVERALRRAARALQWSLALPASLLLWWMDALLWVPLPVALSFVVHDVLLRPRRDGSLRLTLDPDGLALLDPLDGENIEIAWSSVEIARCAVRVQGPEREITLMFADASGPLLALRVILPLSAPSKPTDTDLDAWVRWVGPGAAAIRSLSERTARQSFRDARLLPFLRAALPAERWERTGLRLWSGPAPELDISAHHAGPHDGWLFLEGERWELRQNGAVSARGRIEGLGLCSARRSSPLGAGEIPLLGVTLPREGGPDLRVFFFSPAASSVAPLVTLTDSDTHTHPGEGAALLAHIHSSRPSALGALVSPSEGER